ncbi:MAG: PspC domain-containing protein [Acidimicrobiia bacterium]|nr:PspC domain-containing protein [Acidimicrobiia bacterium]
MTRRSQTLYRDTNDRMITGVCSGLGHYFDIDTTLIRVAFVVFTFIGGGGVLAYLLLSIILDPVPLGPPTGAVPPPPAPAVERSEPSVALDTEEPPVEPVPPKPAMPDEPASEPPVDEPAADEPGRDTP